MLAKEVGNIEIYRDIQALMDSLSLEVVEISTEDLKDTAMLRVFLEKRGGEITTDELENAYNIIYPRYSVIYTNRDLALEITSPGLQRNLKSWHELRVFKGKDVRAYSTKHSSYVIGTIESTDDDTLTLSNYIIEDKNERGDTITLDYNEISKAKLECRWEGRNA